MKSERLQHSRTRREFLGLAVGAATRLAFGEQNELHSKKPEPTSESSDVSLSINQYFNQFKSIAEHDRYSPEDIPSHTLTRYFGLNVLGGDYPDLKIHDIQRLPAKSVLYIGTNPEFLVKLREIDPNNQPRVIHRYYTPDNFIHWNEFRHNVHVAKQFHFRNRNPYEIVMKDRPRITFLNEPNLYNSRWYHKEFGQPELSPEKVASIFMEGARFIKENNGVPLLPPLAPHTPGFTDKFRFGDEIDYYQRMLDSISQHKDFEWITEDLEIDMHSYIRHPGEDIWERLTELDHMITSTLGRRFPVHFTEFGITSPLTEMDPVTRALEIRRVLRTPVPDNIFPIETLNWWTLFALPPTEKQKPGKPPIEDYTPHSLRVSPSITGLDYRVIEYTFQERIDDIARFNEYHSIPVSDDTEKSSREINY